MASRATKRRQFSPIGSISTSTEPSGRCRILTYVLNGLGPVVSWLAPWQRYSPFYQYAEHDPLRHGFSFAAAAVSSLTIAALLGVALIGVRSARRGEITVTDARTPSLEPVVVGVDSSTAARAAARWAAAVAEKQGTTLHLVHVLPPPPVCLLYTSPSPRD